MPSLASASAASSSHCSNRRPDSINMLSIRRPIHAVLPARVQRVAFAQAKVACGNGIDLRVGGDMRMNEAVAANHAEQPLFDNAAMRDALAALTASTGAG